jgi:nitronate monooxygenase
MVFCKINSVPLLLHLRLLRAQNISSNLKFKSLSTAMASSFQNRYPWTSHPLIANAAMGGFAGAPLAAAVSQAGGIGFIGAVDDMEKLDKELHFAKSSLQQTNLKAANSSTLPIGVGFLVFAVGLEKAVAVIEKHRPVAVWLACPRKTEDLEIWSKVMKKASPDSRIWIQVASVSMAMHMAATCSPDVIILQGSDAGGHGPFPGAGIISLVPETRDALDEGGFGDIAVFAAGGICDGRGVAAALACGADGVVMGTRFLASKEIELPVKEYHEAILAAKDGGVATARGTVFDELKGESIWPAGYDGRALAGASYRDFESGISVEEVRKRCIEATKEPHKGFGGEERAALWAGSGVGLVNEVKSASEILQEVRESARRCLEKATNKL